MKSPLTSKNSLALLILLLWSSQLLAQFNKDIVVYPFSKSGRDDSIEVAAKRVVYLLNAQKVFEKTYLNKILVFMPLPDKYKTLVTKGKPYLAKNDYTPLLAKYPDLKNTYLHFSANLKRIVDSDNVATKAENVIMVQRMRDSPQIQEGLLDIHPIKDYQVIMCAATSFEAIRKDPRRNYLFDPIQNDIEQRLLGKPYNLDGYINSINYIPFDLKRLKMPGVVEALIQQNLQLWKRIVDNPVFQKKISAAKINDIKIYDDAKLWLNTDVSSKTVNLSPYLIRAVFNTSFYQDSILRLAAELVNDDGDLRVYFHGKGGASVRRIDAAYFEDFVNRFSKNLFFVLGHELAHIYLAGTRQKDIETACDTYAAYFYLRHFKELDPGIFKTMLISTINSDQLDFWGKDIDRNDLKKRFANLETIRKNKTTEHAAVAIVLPR